MVNADMDRHSGITISGGISLSQTDTRSQEIPEGLPAAINRLTETTATLLDGENADRPPTGKSSIAPAEDHSGKVVSSVTAFSSVVAMYLSIMGLAHWHWKNFDWKPVSGAGAGAESAVQTQEVFVDQQIQQTRMGKINPSPDYLSGLVDGRNMSFPMTIGHGENARIFEGVHTLSIYIKSQASLQTQVVSVDEPVISR